jgi:hypothetical protein
MGRLTLGLAFTFCLAGCNDATHRSGDLPDEGMFYPPADLAMNGPIPDGSAPFDPDAACAVAVQEAKVEVLPVDIIWVIDNSKSMQPAVDQVMAGMNDFATLIANSNLDYRIILVSLRTKTNPVTSVDGKTRYGLCIPPPLSGDANCGNGPRFFHSSVDIRSSQPLEQFLGSLGQTMGYQPGDLRGGEPWAAQLRPGATKTIVVVSDDNSRLSAADFETFAGGTNPNDGTLTLPPGILDASWKGIFAGYSFDGIYGWGSANDPSVMCTYQDGSSPASSGPTYTSLVQKTNGVRAQICDGAAAWKPFFSSVAQGVTSTTKLSCSLALPTPQQGMLDPTKVNVGIVAQNGTVGLFKVADANACKQGGWYYDNDANPTQVILCPASCDEAQTLVGKGGGKIEVQFGCATIIG